MPAIRGDRSRDLNLNPNPNPTQQLGQNGALPANDILATLANRDRELEAMIREEQQLKLQLREAKAQLAEQAQQMQMRSRGFQAKIEALEVTPNPTKIGLDPTGPR